MKELTAFIEEVVKNGVEVSKEEVVAFYTYHPEFERFTGYKSNWKTTTFKKVCTGLGYRINPDREGNRWLKSVNGENKDFYQLVAQEGAMKGVLSTDAAEAPSEPPAPPVVEKGRFSGVVPFSSEGGTFERLGGSGWTQEVPGCLENVLVEVLVEMRGVLVENMCVGGILGCRSLTQKFVLR